jgi:hypothetical protein
VPGEERAGDGEFADSGKNRVRKERDPAGNNTLIRFFAIKITAKRESFPTVLPRFATSKPLFFSDYFLGLL